MAAILKRKMTKEECRDTGMAMVLLLLLLDFRLHREGFVFAAAGVQFVNMVVPRVFAPVAVVWLGLSQLLGAVVPKILLSILFFGVVTPIGVLRRILGKDSLKLREFKASQDSVAFVRNHVFTARDLEKPY